MDDKETQSNVSIWNNPKLYNDCQELYSTESNPLQTSEFRNTINQRFGITEKSREESKANIDSFIQTYQNQPVKDQVEFDKFLLELQKYKLSPIYQNHTVDAGNGPTQISIKVSDGKFLLEKNMVDFIVKQAMLDGSVIKTNPEKYQFLLEKVFEDFSKNINGIDTKVVEDLEYDSKGLGEALGEASEGLLGFEKWITLSKDMVKKFIENKDVGIFITIFHENEHINQQNRLKIPPKSYIDVMMLKENMIIGRPRKLFSEIPNKEYYNDNYEFMFIEIGAREKGAEKTLEYLQSLGIDLKTQTYENIRSKEDLDKLEEKAFYYYGQPVTDIVGVLQKVVSIERENYSKAFTKNVNGKQVNVNEYFSELFPDYHIENEDQLFVDYMKENMNNEISLSQFATAYSRVSQQDKDSYNREITNSFKTQEQEKEEQEEFSWPSYDDFI